MSHFNSKSTTWSQDRADNNKKIVNRKTIQEEFIEHCAVVIQSRFRGLIEKKKYRAFLPIYRRVRQLFYALYSGWKIRRILKLAPIKTQITSIRAKTKIGQTSSSRIAKRELIDDLDRLSKKGRWIQVLHKFRVNSKFNFQGKENSSLYCNVKSKSIKNIFSLDFQREKVRIKIKKNEGENNPINTNRMKNQFADEIRRSRVQNFDDKPLKTHHTISLHQAQTEMFQERKQLQTTKHSFLKKRRQQNKLGEIKTVRNMAQTNIKPKQIKQQVTPKQNFNLQNKMIQNSHFSKRQNVLQQSLARKSTEIEANRVNPISKRKIKITLGSNSATKQQRHVEQVDEPAINIQFMQASATSLHFSQTSSALFETMQVYQNKYLIEKLKMKEKLKDMNMKFTSSFAGQYQHLLNKF